MKLIQILLASAARGTEGGIRFDLIYCHLMVCFVNAETDSPLGPLWSHSTASSLLGLVAPDSPVSGSTMLSALWSLCCSVDGMIGIRWRGRVPRRCHCDRIETFDQSILLQWGCWWARVYQTSSPLLLYPVSIRQSSTVRWRSDCCDMVLDTYSLHVLQPHQRFHFVNISICHRPTPLIRCEFFFVFLCELCSSASEPKTI